MKMIDDWYPRPGPCLSFHKVVFNNLISVVLFKHIQNWPDKSTTIYAMLDFESDRENL